MAINRRKQQRLDLAYRCMHVAGPQIRGYFNVSLTLKTHMLLWVYLRAELRNEFTYDSVQIRSLLWNNIVDNKQ